MGLVLKHKKLSTRGLAIRGPGRRSGDCFGLRTGQGSRKFFVKFRNRVQRVASSPWIKSWGRTSSSATKLSATEKTLADMRKNLAAVTEEGEVFKRRASELKLRFEALGLDSGSGNGSKLEQRLLDAVSNLRGMAQERKKMTEAMVRLVRSRFSLCQDGPGRQHRTSRVALESELRNATDRAGRCFSECGRSSRSRRDDLRWHGDQRQGRPCAGSDERRQQAGSPRWDALSSDPRRTS